MTIPEANNLQMRVDKIISDATEDIRRGTPINITVPVVIAISTNPEYFEHHRELVHIIMEPTDNYFQSRYCYRLMWQLYQIDDSGMQASRWSTVYLNCCEISRIVRGITLKIRDMVIYGKVQVDNTLPGVNGRELTFEDGIIPIWENIMPAMVTAKATLNREKNLLECETQE